MFLTQIENETLEQLFKRKDKLQARQQRYLERVLKKKKKQKRAVFTPRVVVKKKETQ